MPPNIYQLQKGFREITVAQANILYDKFNIPHKRSLMGIGPMTEKIIPSSTLLEEEPGEYGTKSLQSKYDAALKEIELLKNIIAYKNKVDIIH